MVRFINCFEVPGGREHEWESPEQCQAAHGAEFMALGGRPEWAFFTSTPALYEIIDERTKS